MSAAAPQEFTLSISDGAATKQVSRITFTKLADFADFIKRQKPVTNKLDSMAIIASLYSGAARSDAAITSVTALALDFDKAEPGQMEAVCAVLEEEGIGFVAWATWSNSGRFATVLPLSEPTSVAGHQVALDQVRALLGPYGTFAVESSRPGQLRFISPNPNNVGRDFKMFDGPFFGAPQQFEIPETQQSTASAQFEDSFAELVSPAHKQLYLLCLRYGLLDKGFYSDYLTWFPIVAASLRAWGLAERKPTVLSEDQKEMLEALTMWCRAGPGYVEGSLEKKIGKCHREVGIRRQVVGLVKDVDQFLLMDAVQTDPDIAPAERAELMATLQRLGAGNPQVQATTINMDAINAAAEERAQRAAYLAEIRLKAKTILASMPTPTPRFAEFKDIVVALVSQNQLETWELNEDEWHMFLRPAPFIVGMAQIASLGFAPHVTFQATPTLPRKALNPYFLHIGRAGTGKSEGINSLKGILQKTPFKNSMFSSKLHSATGLWTNYFERTGNVQLGFSEEAESLIGKHGKRAKVDPNLAALHTAFKELFDRGRVGEKYRPSAQVQRELREVTAPHFCLHMVATPNLLRQDVGETMLSDGFMSRVIVSIDETDTSGMTEQDYADRLAKMLDGKGPNLSTEKNQTEAAEFFKKLWKDSKHPAGDTFFNAMDDELLPMIEQHFENADLPMRSISYAPKDRVRMAQLMAQAKFRWPIPPGVKNTDTEANIESLRVRSEAKLQILSSLLTLIADPLAKYINYEIAEWTERFLWVTQYDFYRYLLSTDNSGSLLPSYKTNEEALAKLRPAIQEGGPLFGGQCLTKQLNHFSRAWRKLISDLNLPTGSPARLTANDLLGELGVTFTDDAKNNGRTFFLIGD